MVLLVTEEDLQIKQIEGIEESQIKSVEVITEIGDPSHLVLKPREEQEVIPDWEQDQDLEIQIEVEA